MGKYYNQIKIEYFKIQLGVSLIIIIPAFIASIFLFLILVSLILIPILSDFIRLKFFKAQKLDRSSTFKEPASIEKVLYKVYYLIGYIIILIIASLLTIFFHECGHGLMFIILGGEWNHITITPLEFHGTVLGSFQNGDLVKYSWVNLGGNLFTILIGLVMLMTLLIPQIRKLKLSCFLNLTLGICGIASSFIQMFTHSIRHLFGDEEYHADTISFLNKQAQLVNGVTATQLILLTLPFLILIQLMIFFIGKQMWKFHFTDIKLFYTFILLNEFVLWGYFVFHLSF